MLIAPPRATRANTGMLNTPVAITALIAPGPNSAVIRMATMIAGNAKMKSENRSTSHSTGPPHAAAASPSGTPTPAPITTESAATTKLVSVPAITSESISRPR